MDMNEYALEILAQNRLAELRAAAELASRVRAARPVSRPLRVVLGQALIRMGHRLQGVRRSPRQVLGGWRGQATREIDARAESG
jgi:predicted Zn-dependent protease